MFASTTKYTLANVGAFLMFSLLSLKSIAQANSAGGLVTIKIRIRDLRTLTVWQSKKDMLAFRNSGFHQQAMIASSNLGSNQSYSWQTDRIPTWQEAIAKVNGVASN